MPTYTICFFLIIWIKFFLCVKTQEKIDVYVRYLNRIADRIQVYESYKDATKEKMKRLDDKIEVPQIIDKSIDEDPKMKIFCDVNAILAIGLSCFCFGFFNKYIWKT